METKRSLDHISDLLKTAAEDRSSDAPKPEEYVPFLEEGLDCFQGKSRKWLEAIDEALEQNNPEKVIKITQALINAISTEERPVLEKSDLSSDEIFNLPIKIKPDADEAIRNNINDKYQGEVRKFTLIFEGLIPSINLAMKKLGAQHKENERRAKEKEKFLAPVPFPENLA